MTKRSLISLKVNEDDPDVAYSKLPEHPGSGYGVVESSVRLRDIFGDYTGSDLCLEFGEGKVLIMNDWVKGAIEDAERRHAADRDGGYALSRELGRLLRGLSDEGSRAGHLYFARVVRQRNPRLWGVALEALVLADTHDSRAVLRDLWAGREGRDHEWRRQLMLAVTRLGMMEFASDCESEVRLGLAEGHLDFLTVAGRLMSLQPEASIRILSSFFSGFLKDSASVARVQGYLPGILRHAERAGSGLVSQLVESTTKSSVTSGKRLDRMIRELRRDHPSRAQPEGQGRH